VNLHKLYKKISFLENYLPKTFIEEKNLLKALNFADIKLLDKEYILLSAFLWLVLFVVFFFVYIVVLIIKPSLLINTIIYTQLFLAFLILAIYYYPFYLQKQKISLMEEEFTTFFLHFKILVESGLNFNQIIIYLVSNKEVPYPTIQKEFERIYNYAKLYNTSFEEAFKKILVDYPDSIIKSVFLELLNYQRENKDLMTFARKTWEKINEINEEREVKYYSKLDFFMDFYSVILLIFPFLLILVTFIFESVNFIFDKLTSSNVNYNPLNTLFAKTIVSLLLILPIAYVILLIAIDFFIPPHLKYIRKLRNKFLK